MRSSERIVVCIYLLGGNDGNNLVTPLHQYRSYLAARRELALSAGALLRAQDASSGSALGFHPGLTQVHSLFEEGKVAIVASVGARSREQGHQDVSDLAYLAGGFLAPAWAAGVAGSMAVTGFDSLAPDRHAWGNGYSCLTFSGRGATKRRTAILNESRSGHARWQTAFPATSLGRQLSQIAGLLRSGVTAGVRERVFFAVHNGYDTHTDQLRRQARQLAELSEAAGAFYAATVELGLARQVTTYTDSDFGRTLKPNKTGGSDHGWGSHHFVMGGSLAGGRVYGSFPDLGLGGAHDASGGGVWKPGVGKDEYTAALAAWVASDADLNSRLRVLGPRRPTAAFTA
jgi:uncharacterized protein (DUF1501 family)